MSDKQEMLDSFHIGRGESRRRYGSRERKKVCSRTPEVGLAIIEIAIEIGKLPEIDFDADPERPGVEKNLSWEIS